MRVVKTLVAFMGVLIVIGIGLLVYGLSLEKNAPDAEAVTPGQTPTVPLVGRDPVTPDGTAANAAMPLAAFGDIHVTIASDEHLVGFSRQGDDVILHIEGRKGKDAQLVIVSLSRKAVLGRIVLEASDR